jgi:hypothetical protein
MRPALAILILTWACSDPSSPPSPPPDPPAWVGIWHTTGPARFGLDRTRHWATLDLRADSTAEWGDCYQLDYALEETTVGGTYIVAVYGGSSIHLTRTMGNSPGTLSFAWERGELRQLDVGGEWRRLD